MIMTFITMLLVLLTIFLEMGATGIPLTVARYHDIFSFSIMQNLIDLPQARHCGYFGDCCENRPCITHCAAVHDTNIQPFLWFNSLVYSPYPYHLPPAICKGTLRKPGGLCTGGNIYQLLFPRRTRNKYV